MVAPKLRFKEFNNDWSLKKLGDLSFKPQYGMNSSATEFDGENKYLRITDINEDDHSFNFSKLGACNTNDTGNPPLGPPPADIV